MNKLCLKPARNSPCPSVKPREGVPASLGQEGGVGTGGAEESSVGQEGQAIPLPC